MRKTTLQEDVRKYERLKKLFLVVASFYPLSIN